MLLQDWVERVSKVPVSGDMTEPEVCIIELGGTIGDIEGMPFVEAFRQFQFKVKRENFCTVHVSLVPKPKATGEHKTKPTQASVRELRGLGLSPDLIFCRSEQAIDASVRNKISNFCHVEPNQVINIQDCARYSSPPYFSLLFSIFLFCPVSTTCQSRCTNSQSWTFSKKGSS